MNHQSNMNRFVPQDESPNEDGETEPEGEWDESESWEAPRARSNGEAKPHRGFPPGPEPQPNEGMAGRKGKTMVLK